MLTHDYHRKYPITEMASDPFVPTGFQGLLYALRSASIDPTAIPAGMQGTGFPSTGADLTALAGIPVTGMRYTEPPPESGSKRKQKEGPKSQRAKLSEEAQDLEQWPDVDEKQQSKKDRKALMHQWVSAGRPMCGRKIFIDGKLVGTCSSKHAPHLHNRREACNRYKEATREVDAAMHAMQPDNSGLPAQLLAQSIGQHGPAVTDDMQLQASQITCPTLLSMLLSLMPTTNTGASTEEAFVTFLRQSQVVSYWNALMAKLDSRFEKDLADLVSRQAEQKEKSVEQAKSYFGSLFVATSSSQTMSTVGGHELVRKLERELMAVVEGKPSDVATSEFHLSTGATAGSTLLSEGTPYHGVKRKRQYY